jgi:hypothetical protein
MTGGLYVPNKDRLSWHGHARLEKFYADDDVAPVYVDPDGRDLRDNPAWQRRATPYDVAEAENLLLTAGATYVLTRLISDSGTKLDATTGRIGRQRQHGGVGRANGPAGRVEVPPGRRLGAGRDRQPATSRGHRDRRYRDVHLGGSGPGQRRLGRHPRQPVPHPDVRGEGRRDPVDLDPNCHAYVVDRGGT